MNVINDVKPGIDSAYVSAPFDEGARALELQGYRIISLEENAQLRVQEGKEAFVSRGGNWVREGSLYIPKKGRYLVRNSGIIDDSLRATREHRRGKKYFISDEQVEKSLEDSVEVPYDVTKIFTDRFGEDAIARFCFGQSTEEYAEFLKHRVPEITLWLHGESYVNTESKPFVNQLFFYDVREWSSIAGDNLLSSPGVVRGVK